MKQKGLRKLVSMILAVVMCLGLTCTAFAEETTYSITIDPANDGETYTIYKLFDATYVDTDNDGEADHVAYTIDTNTVKGAAWYALVSLDGSPFTATETTTSGVYNVTKSSDSITAAEIVSWLADQTLPSYDYQEEASSDTLTVTVGGAGYYYITTTTGSLVTLDSATPEVTVSDKNGTPSVDKVVSDTEDGDGAEANNAQNGDTVYYTTTISDIKGASNLMLIDTLGDGLTLNENSIVVTYYSSSDDTEGTTVAATNYELNTTTSGFTIDFTDSYESSVLTNASATATLVVTYNATVTSSNYVERENETYVTYGEGSTESSKSTTTTTVCGFELIKVDGTDKTTVLSGAKFKLYTSENGTDCIKFTYDEDTNTYTVDNTDGTIEEIEVGSAYIFGLDVDVTYYLEETVAPAGYNLLTNRVEVTLTASNTTEEYNEETEITTISYADITKVENQSGTELPSTGGMGTTIFYIVGGVLVLGAAVLFVTRKRLGSEN